MEKKFYVRQDQIENYSFFSYLRETNAIKRFVGYLVVQCLILLSFTFLLSPSTSVNSKVTMKSAVPDSEVMGVQSEEEITPTVEPSPTETPPTPTPTPPKTTKNSYTIAVMGDSMVDTMGELLEYLDHSLKEKYPATSFHLYNYGQGAQNVEEGLARFNSEFNYITRRFPAIPQLHPDILIIGSFAYNPFSPHFRDKHWLNLTKLVEQAKAAADDVYILAEIAPLRSDFGRGPNGVNWSANTSYEHSGRIVEQLENAVSLARELRVPVIDAFNPSIANTQTKAGTSKYVNPSDGIHPSIEGHEFIADLIVKTIKLED